MSYHLVDDQLFQNRKFKALMRRGLEGDADAWGAGLLWVMAGSAIKAGYGDGTLSTYDLFSLVPDPSAAPRLAAVLVGAGLWHDAAHPCPYGRCPVPDSHQYVFHDWREYHKKTGEEERNGVCSPRATTPASRPRCGSAIGCRMVPGLPTWRYAPTAASPYRGL